jgi:hypothetical protein
MALCTAELRVEMFPTTSAPLLTRMHVKQDASSMVETLHRQPGLASRPASSSGGTGRSSTNIHPYVHTRRDTVVLARDAVQGVTHVYSLAPPANIAEYVHRAGRTGRIGNAAASSTVTTFASPALGEDVAMRNIAAALGVELLEEQDAPYATGKGDGDEGTGSLLDRLDEEGEEEETADDGAAAIPAEDNIASKDTERANRLTDLFQLMDAQVRRPRDLASF